VLNRLNRRFAGGHPTSDTSQAGVLVHSFDGREEKDKPWLDCTGVKVYCMALARGNLDRIAASIGAACASDSARDIGPHPLPPHRHAILPTPALSPCHSAHVCAAVAVFAGDGKDPANWHLRIYNALEGGIVFNPEQVEQLSMAPNYYVLTTNSCYQLLATCYCYVLLTLEQNNVFCSYVADSGTDMRRCEPQGRHPNCIPGCSGKGLNGGLDWCPLPGSGEGGRGCSWAPQHLHVMMELSMPAHAGEHGWGGQTAGGHYNEVGMDA
jgi:hypothetical protein